ncbi:polysaccharide biosynthesis protein [Oscillospiraceae bacterium CM]|nr:polysaccharide biosynthesis protein [Oscillospiraceae bacterium CM]
MSEFFSTSTDHFFGAELPPRPLQARLSCEINTDDLLGRPPAVLNTEKIREGLHDKTVLVTGGAGSIGSEICQHVLSSGCKKLILFDINENALFALNNAFRKKFNPERYDVVVGSVKDGGSLTDIFARHQIDVVFHAAAHKHVPLMESNPAEAIKNNVFGTLKTAQMAVQYGTRKFILVSTDKAVNATSIMGATKRIAEMIVQRLNDDAPLTELAAVRFGNVLGSSGSVIPMFQSQIRDGGPVTVTHPAVERYFMTIKEAVSLVLLAASMARGGEIFVLDMGKPIKILDLAHNMIRLNGLKPERDILVEFIGLRPGEKMYEELSFHNELLGKTENNKIFVCGPANVSPCLLPRLKKLEEILQSTRELEYKTLLDDIIDGAC